MRIRTGGALPHAGVVGLDDRPIVTGLGEVRTPGEHAVVFAKMTTQREVDGGVLGIGRRVHTPTLCCGNLDVSGGAK